MTRATWSFPWPWEDLTEQQQATRLDEVLDPETAGQFYWNKDRDSYRRLGSPDHAPDWCSAEAVERRRKWLDGHAARSKDSQRPGGSS